MLINLFLKKAVLNYLEVVYKWSFGSLALAVAVLGRLCWQLRSCSPHPLLSLGPWPAPGFVLGGDRHIL